MTVHVSARGRALIKQFEGFRADAYQDVVGVWTIGYGFTRGVQPGQHMTVQQAEARLITELLGYEQAVLGGCALEPNQNQLDAMCSLAWNIGIAGFLRSTVLKCHNRGDAQCQHALRTLRAIFPLSLGPYKVVISIWTIV